MKRKKNKTLVEETTNYMVIFLGIWSLSHLHKTEWSVSIVCGGNRNNANNSLAC